MKVKFLVDYRGVLTDELHFKKGDVAELKHGEQLVKDGRAKKVIAGKSKPEVK